MIYKQQLRNSLQVATMQYILHFDLLRLLSCFLAYSGVGVVAFERRPNIILFLADDVGWGDLSVYGHPTQEPGPVDRMAAEGTRFTQMYAAASFCTPSRAALLTGRQPYRTGLYGNAQVLHPDNGIGLPHDEITIAEALRDFAGYSTGIVGKWHLGINEAKFDDGHFLPNTQGFQYVGTIIPFTLSWYCDTDKRHMVRARRRICFLYRNTTIIEQPIDFSSLTPRLVMDAKAFIYNNQRDPFFLLFSLPQTHTPMFNHADFKGKSRRGIYGDQMNEMSWAVGEVLNVVRELHIEENTLALFLSDHGPHVEVCEEGGSAGPFKEGKGYFGEGAVRVPAIVWWPGRVAAGQVSASVISLLDMFPTLLDIAGVPSDVVNRTLDGRSSVDELLGFTTESQRDKEDILYFHCGRLLVAARVLSYKVYFRKTQFPSSSQLRRLCSEGFPLYNFMTEDCPTVLLDPWLLYDVEKDPSELWPLSVERLGSDTISRLSDKLNSVSDDDYRMPFLTYNNVHRSLYPCCNPPYCVCTN